MSEVEKQNQIEYLLKFHDTIQSMVNKTDDRGAGTINIAVVIAAIAMLISNSINYRLCYIFIPMCVLIVMSIYCFNNRVSAILRGCLAGVEDILAELIGKNIFIFNRGYVPLYHIPFFVTNDIMAGMYGVFAVFGVVFSFYQIIEHNYLPIALSIIYIAIFIVFSSVYVYELGTNGKIKKQARIYYHVAYNNEVIDFKGNSFSNFDQDVKKIFGKYITGKSADINIKMGGST